MLSRLKKYSAPTKFDKEPYGTQWSSFKEDEGVTHYIQVSDDCDAPHWISLGDFMVTAKGDWLLDLPTLNSYLQAYKDKQNKID